MVITHIRLWMAILFFCNTICIKVNKKNLLGEDEGKGFKQLMETFESSSHGFMLETDYMDDPKRPGAVLGPKTVPKRTRQLLAAGLDEEILYNCHRDLPERIYGPV